MENNLRIEMLRQMTTSQLQALIRDDFDCYQKGIDNDQEFVKEVLEVLAERNTNKLTKEQKAEKIAEIIAHAEQRPNIATPSVPKRSTATLGKIIYQRFSRIAAIICVVLLTFAIVIPSVGLAVGPERFIQWTDDTLSLIFFGTHSYEPITDDPCSSWRYVRELAETITDEPLVPQWLPEGYLLDNINIHPMPLSKKMVAVFTDENKNELVFNMFPEGTEVNRIITEKDPSDLLDFTISNHVFYMFSNAGFSVCLWEFDNVSYCLCGNITISEIQTLVKSIFHCER